MISDNIMTLCPFDVGPTCQGTSLSRQFFWGVRKRKKSLNIQLEPWFGSRYVEEDIPHALMKLWKDPPKIDSSLQLPSKNEFLPCDFSIYANKESCESAEISSSRCIFDEPMMRLCYLFNKIHKLPLAEVEFCITLKRGYSSLRNALLTQLFTPLLKDELNEIIY
ncbi:unnamed protein product [Fraxinus pennsylvanica]|uniref:Peptidase M16 middle/third domain-containing protein n=1 Tax=Fraxinus pennsylvanica TaxID=56036 RepID=A0AAD1ZW48_9LAMI|nr:unnamed protein product [Fraxinus pennsylvanica]